MKKSIVTLSLLATTLFATDAMRSEVDLTLGYNKFDSASILENATLFGIRGTIYENEVNKYGLQVGYEGTAGIAYEKMYPKKETDLHRFLTHLVIDGEEEYHVTPYLFLGGGYEYLSDEIKGEPSQGFVDLGIGFKYHLNDLFKILLETRAIGKVDTRDLGLNATLGIGYIYGMGYQPKLEPIRALDKEDVSEKIVPQTVIKEIKVPMKQTTNQLDELAVVVNENEIDDKVMAVAEVDLPSIKKGYSEDALFAGDYYVQMAALEKTPTQPLVDQLADHGFDNTLVYPRGDINLVLVGPFEEKSEAIKAQRVLKSIRSDAFIYRVK